MRYLIVLAIALIAASAAAEVTIPYTWAPPVERPELVDHYVCQFRLDGDADWGAATVVDSTCCLLVQGLPDGFTGLVVRVAGVTAAGKIGPWSPVSDPVDDERTSGPPGQPMPGEPEYE